MEQMELAEKLGRKSSSSISEWEKGKYTPKIKVLNEIAKIFNIEIDDLMNVDLSLTEDNISTHEILLPIDKALGKKIQEVRLKKGLSLEFLVDKMEVRKSKIEKFEQGLLPFTVPLVFRFAKALGVTFDDLFPTTTTEHFDEIPTLIDLDEEHNLIITASGEEFKVDDKEMQQAKDFLTFLHRK